MVPQKSIIKTDYKNSPFYYSRGTLPLIAPIPDESRNHWKIRKITRKRGKHPCCKRRKMFYMATVNVIWAPKPPCIEENSSNHGLRAKSGILGRFTKKTPYIIQTSGIIWLFLSCIFAELGLVPPSIFMQIVNFYHRTWHHFEWYCTFVQFSSFWSL